MKNIVDRILVWLKDVIPTATAVGGWIYNYMLRLVRRAENEKEKVELEKEKLKNEIEVEKELDGKSDLDVVLDVANDDGQGEDHSS